MATVTKLLVPEAAAAAEKAGLPPTLQWHRVLLATLRQQWTSLVAVPASRGTSAFGVAKALAAASRYYRPTPVELVDATGMEFSAIGPLVNLINSASSQGKALIITVDPLVDNQAAIPIVLAAEAALLCITLGQTDFESANETLDLIRDKTIGSVAIRPRPSR